MGNPTNKKNIIFTNDDKIFENIKQNYKCVNISFGGCAFFDVLSINDKIENDDFFKKSPHKKEIIKKMVEFYLKNDEIVDNYYIENYFCNEEHKLCICNDAASYFRKIHENNDHIKTINWFIEKK